MISVIIPTCNRNELLSKCLDKLHPSIQSVTGNLYEVIVSDDSNNNISKDLIQNNYNWAKWVEGRKKGPAANRNNGAAHASGEWLVFIDDDCVPDNNLLNTYSDAIKSHPQNFAFEGAILPDSWELLKKDMAECPINLNGDCFWSANICVQKKLFENIGGFDESYLIAAQEDQQLKIDIERKEKLKIIFIRSAIVVHPVRFATFRKKVTQIPIASKNFCLYAYRNKKLLGYISLLQFIKSQTFFHVRNVISNIKQLRLKRILLSLLWLCYGVPLNAINFYSLSKKKP